jgi:hypothetical protein
MCGSRNNRFPGQFCAVKEKEEIYGGICNNLKPLRDPSSTGCYRRQQNCKEQRKCKRLDKLAHDAHRNPQHSRS